MLDEILKIHQSGRFEEAEQRYREWLAFNPDDPEALHLLAIVRRQREDLAEALEFAERAVEIAPDRANYQLTLAGLLLHARQLPAAREGFATALRLNPNLPGAALGVAQVALVQGDLDGAQEAMSRAERLAAPDHPQLLAQKAALMQARGDHEGAARQYLEAAKRNPNDPAVQANLARSFVALGKTAFAEQALRNALRLKPGFAAARITLAQLLLKEQQPEEALAEFEQVLEQHPEHPLALAGRGDIRHRRGDLVGAVEDYRRAHAGAPDIAGIAAALVRTLFAQGLTEDARSVLRQALERAPADAVLRRLDLADASGADAAAQLQACRSWLAAAPDSVEAQDRLATRLELTGNHAEADQIARDALARNSRTVFARLILARSALREGRAEQAQEQLNRIPDALLSAPGRVDRALLRGLARDRLGDLAGAVESWHTGLRLQSGLAPLMPLPADPAALPRPLPAAAEASSTGGDPCFLLALPGAGSESLVALLRHLDLRVLADRFSSRPRADALASGGYAALFAAAAEDAEPARSFREQYLAALAETGQMLEPDQVDWLPFVDIRQLLLIEAAFSGARYLILERDPRDCLLTWLAMGTPQALAMDDPTVAGAWLQVAAAHLQVARSVIAGDRQLVVDRAGLEDPATLAPRIAAFLGRPTPEAAKLPASTLVGRGGLPTLLPDGRWQAYGDVLGPALSESSDGSRT